MRNIIWSVIVSSLVSGGILGTHTMITKKQTVVVVDVSNLIHERAKVLSKASLSPQALAQHLENVRHDLVQALDDFAHQNQIIVASAKSVWGELPDYSQKFEEFFKDRDRS